jgi:hypothetical protein
MSTFNYSYFIPNNVPVWFHLKGHNPGNIPLLIPVIFDRKREMVVDEVFFILALPNI